MPDPSTRRLRWGILGAANINKRLIPAMQASRNGDVVAIASRSQDKANHAAQQFGIPQAYGSYEALLADPTIEAVYNPLPNHLHQPWTVAALAAGKHVLCEKPLALDAEEAQAMRDAAAQHALCLMEAFMYRFHPRMRELRRLLDEGVIGDVHFINAVFSFQMTNLQNIRLDPTMGGGAIMDIGSYGLNFSRYIAGVEPSEVFAFGEYGKVSTVDESVTITMRFPNGILAHVDCSFRVPRRMWAEVVGSAGRIVVPSAWLPGMAETILAIDRSDSAPETLKFAGIDQYQIMVEEFAEAVMSQQPVPLPVTDAVNNMRVIDAVRRSAATNQPVRL